MVAPSFFAQRLKNGLKLMGRASYGLTLTEVVVSLALIAVLGAIFYNILFATLKTREVSRERLQAVTLAASLMDEIKSLQSLQDGWQDREGLMGWLLENNFTETGGYYKKTVSVDNRSYNLEVAIGDPDENGFFIIRIAVSSPRVKEIILVAQLKGEK